MSLSSVPVWSQSNAAVPSSSESLRQKLKNIEIVSPTEATPWSKKYEEAKSRDRQDSFAKRTLRKRLAKALAERKAQKKPLPKDAAELLKDLTPDELKTLEALASREEHGLSLEKLAGSLGAVENLPSLEDPVTDRDSSLNGASAEGSFGGSLGGVASASSTSFFGPAKPNREQPVLSRARPTPYDDKWESASDETLTISSALPVSSTVAGAKFEQTTSEKAVLNSFAPIGVGSGDLTSPAQRNPASSSAVPSSASTKSLEVATGSSGGSHHALHGESSGKKESGSNQPSSLKSAPEKKASVVSVASEESKAPAGEAPSTALSKAQAIVDEYKQHSNQATLKSDASLLKLADSLELIKLSSSRNLSSYQRSRLQVLTDNLAKAEVASDSSLASTATHDQCGDYSRELSSKNSPFERLIISQNYLGCQQGTKPEHQYDLASVLNRHEKNRSLYQLTEADCQNPSALSLPAQDECRCLAKISGSSLPSLTESPTAKEPMRQHWPSKNREDVSRWGRAEKFIGAEDSLVAAKRDYYEETFTMKPFGGEWSTLLSTFGNPSPFCSFVDPIETLEKRLDQTKEGIDGWEDRCHQVSNDFDTNPTLLDKRKVQVVVEFTKQLSSYARDVVSGKTPGPVKQWGAPVPLKNNSAKNVEFNETWFLQRLIDTQRETSIFDGREILVSDKSGAAVNTPSEHPSASGLNGFYRNLMQCSKQGEFGSAFRKIELAFRKKAISCGSVNACQLNQLLSPNNPTFEKSFCQAFGSRAYGNINILRAGLDELDLLKGSGFEIGGCRKLTQKSGKSTKVLLNIASSKSPPLLYGDVSAELRNGDPYASTCPKAQHKSGGSSEEDRAIRFGRNRMWANFFQSSLQGMSAKNCPKGSGDSVTFDEKYLSGVEMKCADVVRTHAAMMRILWNRQADLPFNCERETGPAQTNTH